MILGNPSITEEKLADIAELLRGGLNPSTVERYNVGLRFWRTFRQAQLGFPPEHPVPLSILYMTNAPPRQITVTVIDFMRWLIEERNVKSDTAVSYVTHVRSGFVTHLSDISAFDAGSAMTLARSSMRALNTRMERLTDRAEHTEIQPLLPEMLTWLRGNYWNEDIDSSMTYMAIAFSYNFITRISEVVNVGPYINLKTGKPRLLDHRPHFNELVLQTEQGGTYQIDTYFQNWPLPIITYFRLELISNKTSHRAAANLEPYQCHRRGNEQEIQFFDDFMSWIHRCGVRTLESPIFSRLHPHTMRYAECQGTSFRSAMKCMAKAFGIDPKYYSGKSTRIGGATNMRAAGRSDADQVGLAGHHDIAMTMRYVSAVSSRGNVLSNSQEDLPTVNQLKRLLTPPATGASLRERDPPDLAHRRDPSPDSEPDNKGATSSRITPGPRWEQRR